MRIPRRFLPSLALLQAFEAAARTGSITAAARELSLTQSAVSRQIRALEAQLGTPLFHREKQSIRLTPGGEAYAREIREALRRISMAAMNLRANPLGGTLDLAILPTFGARWLAPRLPGFLKTNPGITINLVTRLTRFDFSNEASDAAIQFGKPDWPDCDFAYLRTETLVPLCAPAMLRTGEVASVQALLGLDLLHLTSRPDEWEGFFIRQGVDPGALHGMMFDQFATVAHAAQAGLGVALLPEFLVRDEPAAGKLVPAIARAMQSDDAYYLCWPRSKGQYQPLVAFRDWITAVARQDDEESDPMF